MYKTLFSNLRTLESTGELWEGIRGGEGGKSQAERKRRWSASPSG